MLLSWRHSRFIRFQHRRRSISTKTGLVKYYWVQPLVLLRYLHLQNLHIIFRAPGQTEGQSGEHKFDEKF